MSVLSPSIDPPAEQGHRGQATEPVPPAAPPPPSRRRKPKAPVRPRGFLGTAIGKKVIMAVTGVIMVGFLVLHMIGNLKIFSGRDAFNEYSEWLRLLLYPALPYSGFLWILRAVLIVSVIAHITAAIQLARRARRARPVRYAAGRKSVAQTYASRTLRLGGVILALYVVYHLLDMTFGVTSLAGTASTPADRYVIGFQHWYIVLLYTVPLLLLGMHLRHGLWSALQSVGAGGDVRRARLINLGALAVSLGLVGGFLIGPYAVLFGVIS